MGPGHRRRNSDCRTPSPGGPPCCSENVAAQDQSGKENEHAKPAPQIPHALVTPSLKRGVGFTYEERDSLGLTGRLPSAVLTLDQQAERVWRQLQSIPTALARNPLMDQLHYRNERLYFQVRSDP